MRSTHERRGLTRLAVLCLPVAATLILPAAAFAATGTSTVIATVNGDGSVKAVKVVAANGSTGNFNGSLPVKVSISRSVSGGTSTYTYHVENTFSKEQVVTYTDTAGKQHSVTTTVQLPLVARLGVQVPKTFKNVTAPNGVVQTDPDGVNRVLFSLVLFSPIGSPTQDVTFSATGAGVPTSELSATTVNPSTTSGLASASQDATASQQQDDFWTGFANGGNGGLTQLADGMGKIVAGLGTLAPGAHKLADGLAAAGDGANKLDAGTAKALDGSQQLTAGAATASSGGQKLATGARAAFAGSQQLATGSRAAADGAGLLSSGLGQLATGQTALNGGLAQIQGGLAQLDAQTPAAVTGLTAIEAGVRQILVGLQGAGGTTSAPTMANPTTPSVLLALNGTAGQLPPTGGIHASVTTARQSAQAALALVEANAAALTPVLGAKLKTLLTELGTAAAPANDPFFAGTPLAGGGILPGVEAGLTSLSTGITTITLGLNNHLPKTFGPSDPGGIDFGLLALLDPTRGLPAAVAGIHALSAGATSALAGSNQLTAGTSSAFSGSQKLATGVGQVAGGASALSSGLGQISGGLDQLSPGLVKIAAGLGTLTTGLGQLSSGQHQVATGLPAAVSGASQIADGADQLSAGAVQVHTGILAVQTGAVGPLLQQLQTGSQNAAKQVAILEATGAMASQAPGGAGSTYVLTQSPQGFKLAAAVSVPTSDSSSSSDTGRNIGIGVGGLAALVIAVVAGFALGRRSGVSA